MHVRNKAINVKKILRTDGISTTPRVLNYVERLYQTGKKNRNVELEFYAKVNLRNFSTNKRLFDASKIVDVIEFTLIPESIQEINKLADVSINTELYKTNIVNDDRDLDKSIKIPKGKTQSRRNNNSPTNNRRPFSLSNLTYSIGEMGATSLTNISRAFDGTHFLGSISTKNFSKIVQEDKYQIRLKDISDGEGNISRRKFDLEPTSFKKAYLSMIENNFDPAFLFQDSFGKTNYIDQRKGITTKVGSWNKNDRFETSVLPLIDNAVNIISGDGKDDLDISPIKNISETGTFKLKSELSLEKLRSFGDSITLMLTCKNKSGVILETAEYRFKYDNVVKQINGVSTEYWLGSVRKSNNESKLTVKNNNKQRPVDVSIHAKRIKRSVPFEKTMYKNIAVLNIQPSDTAQVRDGNVVSKSSSSGRFKDSESIFYRATINVGEDSYSNARVTFDKSKVKQENTPDCVVYAQTSTESDNVIVTIRNISENVVACKPMKYTIVGGARKNLTNLLSSNTSGDNSARRLTEYLDVKGTQTSLTVNDKNSKDGQTYMYVVDCVMKNGEIKRSPAHFIHKFKKREGSILISDISVSALNNLSGIESEIDYEADFKTCKLNFKVNKIQTEVDKILKNMFGDLFEIFKDNLEKIKDLQGLVYSIEVIRLNKDTGEAETINKVTPDENGICELIDNNCPVYYDVDYILSPRVALASSLIDEINGIIENLGSKTIFNSLNYVNPSERFTSKKREKEIFSSVGSKFSRRKTFLKGMIDPPNVILDESNFDIFFNSGTGDVAYAPVAGILSQMTSNAKKINITNPVIEEIKFLTTDNGIRNYSLTFGISKEDYFVDFYCIFIKENNDVYLNGIMHSRDTTGSIKKYSYLVSHKKSIGKIEYYLMPFFKNGLVGSPIPIAGQILK